MDVPDLLERAALSIPEVCASTNMGRTKVYEAIKDGKLRAYKWGTRTLVFPSDLRAFLSSLPNA